MNEKSFFWCRDYKLNRFMFLSQLLADIKHVGLKFHFNFCRQIYCPPSSCFTIMCVDHNLFTFFGEIMHTPFDENKHSANMCLVYRFGWQFWSTLISVKLGCYHFLFHSLNGFYLLHKQRKGEIESELTLEWWIRLGGDCLIKTFQKLVTSLHYNKAFW